ncbi:MAG: acyltransferase [Deltaproteobacteria bacterium]|nr:acyltransferase [Deltaproteobacteria bacterium]
MTDYNLTPQIKTLSNLKFRDLPEILVGRNTFTGLIAFEVYENLLKKLAGVTGIILRRVFLRLILKNVGKKLTCEEAVTILGGKRISVGDGVFLRKYSSLEARFGGTIELGNSVLINQGTIVCSKGGSILISDGVNISSHCRIASNANLFIGKSVLISAFCYIGAPNHDLSDPVKTVTEKAKSSGVSIGNNVWIGAHTTVLDGVVIGENSVIGANSFVNRDIPSNVIAFGTPARVVRQRILY